MTASIADYHALCERIAAAVLRQPGSKAHGRSLLLADLGIFRYEQSAESARNHAAFCSRTGTDRSNNLHLSTCRDAFLCRETDRGYPSIQLGEFILATTPYSCQTRPWAGLLLQTRTPVEREEQMV